MAKRKGAEARTEVEDVLDEVLTTPKVAPVEEVSQDEEESPADPAAERGEQPEDADPSDGAPSTAREEAAGSQPEGSPAAESTEDEAGADESEAEKRAAGLQREITELRRKLAEARASQQSAPTPPPAAQTTAPAPQAPPKPKGVPVVVSEDGRQVYVDPDALTKTVEERARQLYEEMRKPTPEQVREMENRTAVDAFVAENPAAHQAVVGRAKDAEDFIALQIQSLMSQGHQIGSVQHAIQAMKDFGVSQSVATYFPEVAPMLDEFVEGMASGNPTWRRSLLSRMAQGAAPVDAEDAPARPVVAPVSPLRPVTGMPQSLARKGGTRSQSPSADEAEFTELAKEFSDSVIFMPEKRYERLRALGKKLGKPGYE